mgnify:FL=1
MEQFTIADWIALVSVIISLIALVKSFLTDRKAKDLDLQLKQQQIQAHEQDVIESKKADIEVNVIQTPRGEMNSLRFYNKGKAIALNIRFDITDDPEDNIMLRMPKDFLPYPTLHPQQSFDVRFLNQAKKPHQTIKIVWDDAYEKNRSKEMTVDM